MTAADRRALTHYLLLPAAVLVSTCVTPANDASRAEIAVEPPRSWTAAAMTLPHPRFAQPAVVHIRPLDLAKLDAHAFGDWDYPAVAEGAAAGSARR